MPEISEFPPGLPCWADLSTTSAEESAEFYAGLFGWEVREGRGDADQTGGYQLFVKDGRQVAGLMQTQEQPPSWNTYVSVSDADEVAAKVKEAGGQLVVEPMDIMDQGRMAFLADPTGAALGVWQAKEHKGAELVSEPGATAWHQLNTRDPEKAGEFYRAVFGWDYERVDTGGADYWEWRLDGKNVGGMFRMGDDFPEELAPHWIVYFAVEDADAATENATRAGAQVRAEPFDSEAGRFAVLTDPHGAAFAVIDQGGGGVAGRAGGEGDEAHEGDKESEQEEDGADERL
jgi:predicted enzyme related to lactoylglutathione lyase